jgi:ribosomal protein L29
MPDLGVIASLVAVPLALATVVFAYLTWREARATVKPLRLMAEEQQEALAQQRAQRRLAQLERIGADVAAARADLVSIEFSGGRASGNELKTLRRALADLEMALQSQQADALPRCRELVRDIRLDAVHRSPADTVMPALSEIEAALQATPRG